MKIKSSLVSLIVLILLAVLIVESEIFFDRDLSYYWFGAICVIIYIFTKHWLDKDKALKGTMFNNS